MPFEYTGPAKTAVPVLSTVRSEVVVADVDEPIVKRFGLVSPTFAWIESFADGEVVAMPKSPDTKRFDEVAFTAKRFVVDANVEKKFVLVAFPKIPLVAEKLVEVAFVVVLFVARIFAKVLVPVNVGEAEKTAKPVPVSSVRIDASSAEVSIEVVPKRLEPFERHTLFTAKHPAVMLKPLAAVVEPEPETEKSVVVPVPAAEDDAIAKMVLVLAKPDLSITESFANGEEVPIPMLLVDA